MYIFIILFSFLVYIFSIEVMNIIIYYNTNNNIKSSTILRMDGENCLLLILLISTYIYTHIENIQIKKQKT